MKHFVIGLLCGLTAAGGASALAQVSKEIDLEDAVIRGGKNDWQLQEPFNGQLQRYSSINSASTNQGKKKAVICTPATASSCDGAQARDGDQFLSLPTGPSTQNLTRQEFYIEEDAFKHGDDVWLGFAMRLSSDWETRDLPTASGNEWRRVFQLAAGPDGNCSGFGHSLSLYVSNLTAGTSSLDLQVGQGPGSPGCFGVPRLSVGTEPLVLGEWYDIVINFKMNPTGGGYVNAWVKLASAQSYIQFASYSGAVGWSNNSASDEYGTRIGHYGDSTDKDITMFMDNVRFGAVNGSNFAAVDPSGSTTPPTSTVNRLENLQQNKWLRMTSTTDGAGPGWCTLAPFKNLNVQGASQTASGDPSKWELRDAGNGEVFVYNVGQDAHLLVSGNVTPDPLGTAGLNCGSQTSYGVHGASTSCVGSWAKWTTVDAGGGYFRLQNSSTGYWLQMTNQTDIDDGPADGGVQVRALDPCQTGDATKWRLVPAN